MKLDQKVGNLLKSNHLVQNQFSIKASAKAYEAVYGKLYSNNIKAIIRELSCNAYDSHVEAGKKDVPFDVKLPNALDLEFYIRDYGTGISPENIEKVYTVVFESTKTETNDQVGCLGLGSKTPFSYTENFIVETYYNGKKYTYSMYLDKERNPSYTLMTTTNTTEPNGLLVKFSTKRDDYTQWLAEAKEVYPYFETCPKIMGNANFKAELEKKKPMMEFGVFKMYESANSYNNKASIIMGNIKYDIKEYDYNFGARSCDITAKVNIGDVDFTTSREALEYSDKTKKKIRELIADFKLKISKEMEKEVAGAKDYWDAYQIQRKLMEKYPVSSMTFNGQILEGKKLIFAADAYVVKRINYNQRLKERSPYGTDDLIGSQIFVASEKSPKYMAKFRDYIEKNNIKTGWLIKSIDNTKGTFKELSEWAIYPNHVINLDTLPDLPKVPKAPGTVVAKAKNCVQGYIIDKSGKQGISNVPLGTPEYYIQCCFNSYAAMTINGVLLQGYDGKELVDIIKVLNTLLNKDIRVIAVTESNMPKIDPKYKWIKFEDFFNTLKAKFQIELKSVKRATLAEAVKNNNISHLTLKHKSWLKTLVDNSARWLGGKKKEDILKIMSYWGYKEANQINLVNLINKQYPLLKHTTLSYLVRSYKTDNQEIEHISDYINMIEERKNASRNKRSSKKSGLPTNVVI